MAEPNPDPKSDPLLPTIAKLVGNGSIVCCAGPSLNDVNIRSFGLPVVAISTAICTIPKPDIWFHLDYFDDNGGLIVDGDDRGRPAARDDEIVKVSVTNRRDRLRRKGKYVPERAVWLDEVNEADMQIGSSLQFAVFHLVRTFGCRKILFAGIDGVPGYAHRSELEPGKADRQIGFHKNVHQGLLNWITRSEGLDFRRVPCMTSMDVWLTRNRTEMKKVAHDRKREKKASAP